MRDDPSGSMAIMLQVWEMAEELAEKKVVGADGQVWSEGIRSCKEALVRAAFSKSLRFWR